MKDRDGADVRLTDHLNALREALRADDYIPAGRLYGLPDLPEGDCWVDIAGAAALTGVHPKTITAWLSRKGPKRYPFPPPRRILYRLYWRHSLIEAWRRQAE
jgi:hypothetical protein